MTASRSTQVGLLLTALIVAGALAVGVWLGTRGSASAVGMVPAANRPLSVERDQLAPLFSLPDAQGQLVSLASYDGDVVLVNFWATWCIPCRDEMPVLEAAYQKHRGRGFRVVAVNVQERPDQVIAYGRELGLTFPLLLDEAGEVKTAYRVQALPRSFFLARDGRVIRIHPGEMTTEIVERYLSELL